MLNDLGQLIFEPGTVKLKPYQPRPFKKYELLSDQELLDGAGGYMIWDSECHPNFYFIGFKCLRTGKIHKLKAPFNVQKLSWIMHNYTLVGFQSLKFDSVLAWYSYVNQDTEAIKNIANELILAGKWPKALEQEYGFTIHPTKHVDLIEVCPLRGSLKLYGARLHSKRIQELPFDHMKNLTREEKDIVADYCINDLDVTELLMVELKEQLDLRMQLSQEYRQNLMSKSDAQIAEAVIGSELKRLTGKWPKKPQLDTSFVHKFQVPHNLFFQTPELQNILNTIANATFSVNENSRLEIPNEVAGLKIKIGNSIYRMGIGGLHSSEKNVSVKSNDEYQLYDKDVASYYPAIVLNGGLYPQHLGADFLQVYRSLVDRRLAAKKAKNIAVSECIKITINGTFGKTGSPYSFLYAPEMTIQITVGGQLYLLMLIECLELRGITVVSANTDGILIYCRKDKVELMQQTIKDWETITGFTTEETKYEAIYSRDVNAYLAVKSADEVKGKNVYYDPWRAKTARDGYWRFQKNPNGQICVEASEKLITKGTPIETTITECKDITKFIFVKNVTGGAHKDGHYLGKVIRWYYAKGVYGTINYVSSGNKVPDSDGAKPCMDLPESFPTDVDYDAYIRRTKEMLTDMAYYSPEKQLRFF